MDAIRAIGADLLGGPAVQPQDAVAQRRAVGLERRERLSLLRHTNGADAGSVCGAEAGDDFADCVPRGLPPADGIVLVLIHRRGVQLDGPLGGAQHVAVDIDDDGLRGGR